MRTTQRTQPNRDLTRWRQAYSRGDTRTLRPEARARGETPDPPDPNPALRLARGFRSSSRPVPPTSPFVVSPVPPPFRAQMAVLADALRTRARGNLGAASLPRHLRRRATSHVRPYKLALRRRPNAKRRRTLEARGLDPSADGAAAYAFAFTVETKHVRVRGAARRDDVLSARDAPSRPASRARRLETHLWHAKRFVGRRRARASSRRSVDPVAAAVGARSIATREPPRWRTTRRTTPRSRWWVLARPWTRRFATSSTPVASASSHGRVRARRDGARRRHSRRRGRPRRARHVPPIRHGRRRGDGVDARGGGGDGGSDPRRRRETGMICARVASIARRRASKSCGATARDVVDAILGGGRALDDVDGVFGETCEVPRGVASRARTAGIARDAARRVSAKRRIIRPRRCTRTSSRERAADHRLGRHRDRGENAREGAAPATPSEYAAYRASRRARAFRLHCRDGGSSPPRLGNDVGGPRRCRRRRCRNRARRRRRVVL